MSTERYITLEAILQTSEEPLIFSVENTDRLDAIYNFAPKVFNDCHIIYTYMYLKRFFKLYIFLGYMSWSPRSTSQIGINKWYSIPWVELTIL